MIRRLIILLLIVGCVFGDTIIKSSFGGDLTIKDVTFIKVEDSMAIYEFNGKELSLDCSKVIQILDDKDKPIPNSCVVDCAGELGGSAFEDCQGICGGDAIEDKCGVCDGNNSTCADECGVPNGDNSTCVDECGVPNGDNSTCLDECGVPNGDNSSCLDECGVPNGDNSSCLDCAGVPNGNAIEDNCGVCGGGNSTCIDCAGVPNGDAVEDCAGICGGNNKCGCTEKSACNYRPIYNIDDGSCKYAEENYDCGGYCVARIDCLGVCGGDAVIDKCGICNGDDICDPEEIELIKLKKKVALLESKQELSIKDSSHTHIGGILIGIGGALVFTTLGKECGDDCELNGTSQNAMEKWLKNTKDFENEILDTQKIGFGLITLGGILVAFGI